MCRKLIYLTSFVLVLVFTLSSHAAYLDAKGGASGNTVNASTGSTTDWWTTAAAADGLWREQTGTSYGNDASGNIGTAAGTSYESGGNGAENCPAITTTISGLAAGKTYSVSVVYWSHISQDWAIRAGFSLGNMLYFDRTGSGGATAGTTGRTRTTYVELVGFIGYTQADVNGKIKVYIDDKPPTSASDRTWYDGIRYEAATKAYRPNPGNGSSAGTSLQLSWNPGIYAAKHDIYLADNWADVNSATSSSPKGPDKVYKARQDPNSYSISGLMPGVTYYWRVDEVNGLPDYAVYRGDIWSFTATLVLPPGFTQLTLNNANFDATTLADGAWNEGVVASWTVGGSASQQNLSAGGGLSPEAKSGQNICAMNEDSSIYQVPQDGGSNVTVQPDQTYKVSVWVGKRSDECGTVSGILQVYLQESSGSTRIDQRIYDLNDQPKNSWTYQTFYLATGANPAGTGSNLQLGFMNNSNRVASNQWWFDQADIDSVSIISAPPIAINPNPANGGTSGTDVTLQWKPGPYATRHDVYFGTELSKVTDANRTNPLGILVSQGWEPNNYSATGLTPGVTYYWRIDETDGVNIWQGDIWRFTVLLATATNPSPPHGAKYVDTNVVLSWTRGVKAQSHDVYFGTNPSSLPLVSSAQTSTTYDPPGALNYNTVYYWRIDERNTDSTITTGDLWRFTTLPYIPPTDPNLVAWWKLDDGEGSIALDWSTRGNNGTIIGNASWVAGQIDGALELHGVDYVDCGNPASLNIAGRITLAAWVNTNDSGNSEDNPYVTKGDTSYALRHSTGNTVDFYVYDDTWYVVSLPVDSSFNSNWHHLAGTYDGNNVNLYVDGTLRATDTHVGSIASSPFNVAIGRDAQQSWQWYDGVIDDVRIYNRALTQADIAKILAPVKAWLPNPTNGATDVEPTPTLSWRPGAYAAKHDVYFSDNFDAVNDANSSDPCGSGYVYKGRQNRDSNSYGPVSLNELDKTYYWRIDEVNLPNIWRGDIWSFTTRDFIPVDDFESYNNTTRIQNTWIKGGGGKVGYNDPNYAEVTIVHAGAQSMPFDYNNTSPTYSDANRTFATPQDWTVQGVKALSLWLRGWPVSVGSFIESPAGTYTMTASGTDIWDVPDLQRPSRFHDEFHYAYMQVSSDCTIVAKVESISNTNAYAKAGLMIRDSADADSSHAMVCITPSSGVRFQYRVTAGGSSTEYANDPNITAPCWLKLQRQNNEIATSYDFIASYSTCGPTGEPNNWKELGTATISYSLMTDPVCIGLSLTAHNASATCTGVFSNVTVNDETPPSWTHQDIGIKSNTAAPLYVTLKDSTNATKTVTHPDPNVVLQSTWQAWDIALSDFAPVEPNKITKITIGVGSKSTPVGTLYFDDIRLYIPRCMPGTLPDSADSSCLVSYPDLQILTNNWLVSNYPVTPAAPGNSNLVAYYTFDGNFDDSSGGHNGEPNGASIITNLTRGQVANFDGVNDYVKLPIGPDVNSMNSTTIATWVNFSNAGGSWQRIFDFGKDPNVYMFLSPRIGTTGVMRFAITTTSSAGESIIDAPSTLARGWHHVAVAINGVSKTMQMYLDGIVVASGLTQTLPKNLGNTTQNWLGRSQWAADAYFIGYLDDFRIYNRALSQGEVASLAGKTSFTQPLYLLLTPHNPGINLYNDGRIDLRDYAVLAEKWLEVILWP